jgi:hypothetical protein
MQKIRLPLTLFLLFPALMIFSQNTTPLLTNIQSLADTVFHQLTVSYDLADSDDLKIEVSFNASFDNGFSYQLNTADASGDVGYPVFTGTGKKIVWQYPDSLTNMLQNFKIMLTATDREPINIQQLVDMVDTNNLRQYLGFIVGIRHRTTGAAHLEMVRDTLQSIMNQNSLQTRAHDFPFGSNYTGKNIIGRKQGVVNNKKTFIVGGHYDTVSNSPGADDNGSSIAAILEILRIIAPLPLRNSVNLIGFDLEESGLAGSIALVQNGMMPYEQVEGMINMDMIGYYTEVPNSQIIPQGFSLIFPELYAEVVANEFRGNFIISTANYASASLNVLFDSLAALYVPSLLVGPIDVPGNGEVIPDSRRSDHAAFWDAGIMAMHISDGAETRNPNYHSPADIIDSLHFGFMANVTKATLATLLALAEPIHGDVKEVNVLPDPASSVIEINANGCMVFISPNPVDRMLNIKTTNCNNEIMQLKIMTAEGKIVFQKIVNPNIETRFYLDNSLSAGNYFIELSNAKQNITRKLVVR